LLQAFFEADLRLAFASRTQEPAWANELINIFQVDDQGRCLADYAHACEIYPTSKDKHFKALARKLDVGFEEMLFFDDERRNIHDVSRLGVVSVHCEDGISLAALEQGLRRFRERATKTAGDNPKH
jgi:magnesium-dependent phosphatase 1